HNIERHDGREHVRPECRGEQPGLLLTVKGHVDCSVFVLVEVVAGTRKGERPYAGGIFAHDEDHAVRIRRRYRAMGEGARLVVAEGAAGPAANSDGTKRSFRMS